MRALISTNHFADFAGSEIVTLELIEWFISKAYEVELITTRFDNPIRQEVSHYLDSNQLTVHVNSGQQINPDEFDIIWINHSLVPLGLLTHLTKNSIKSKVIWLHMGSLNPLEKPIFGELECLASSHILAVSERTRWNLKNLGLESGEISIFNNPVPENFIRYTKHVASRKLSSILLVSNHPPEELLEAGKILKECRITMSHLGINGDFQQRVSPELLCDYDAVITIGKTTQYCLALGIPVFLYDHFGGAGWLNSSNFEFESSNNFTGYGTNNKMTPQKIASEVISGFPSALSWAQSNKIEKREQLSLDTQMKNLLSSPNTLIQIPVSKQGLIHQANTALEFRWSQETRISSPLKALLSSNSFKITKPLRALKQALINTRSAGTHKG
jgi:hypothetical protein